MGIEVKVFFWNLETDRKNENIKVTAFFSKSLRQVRRLVIAVIGFTVLAIGLVMVVLPGPALLVIPVALGILATEFVWAKKLINKVKNKFSSNLPKN
ncbi:MAG: PGPGW domain-containing protein [Deltaproteobacteria bacterium]|nr:PGPGW domain-containing protein [Deltaproteobacteria bacterium]